MTCVLDYSAKCKLRQMKLERIKDYLLLESEFIRNQEVLKPKAERETEQRDKVLKIGRPTPAGVRSYVDLLNFLQVEEMRGMPLTVGTLEEMIDDNHCIVSSSGLPDQYVCILSIVDADALEPGCSVLLRKENQAVVGILGDEADPLVAVMKARSSGIFLPRYICLSHVSVFPSKPWVSRSKRHPQSLMQILAASRSRFRRLRRPWSYPSHTRSCTKISASNLPRA